MRPWDTEGRRRADGESTPSIEGKQCTEDGRPATRRAKGGRATRGSDGEVKRTDNNNETSMKYGEGEEREGRAGRVSQRPRSAANQLARCRVGRGRASQRARSPQAPAPAHGRGHGSWPWSLEPRRASSRPRPAAASTRASRRPPLVRLPRTAWRALGGVRRARP